MLRSDGSFWTCLTCTLLNSWDSKACIVCDTTYLSQSAEDPPREKQPCSSPAGLECPVCTFVNDNGSYCCQMCTSDLDGGEEVAIDAANSSAQSFSESTQKKSQRSSQYRQSHNDSESDAASGSDESGGSNIPSSCYYDAADKLFSQLIETIGSNGVSNENILSFRCKSDGRICRTKGIMTAYLVKQHRESLHEKAVEISSKNKKDKEPNRKSNNISSSQFLSRSSQSMSTLR